MQPLTLDDLLPLAEFASQRAEFFAAHRRYLDRYRRIRIGPRVALVFENRQTLWFRVQEVLRVARLAEPDRVQQELDLYNALLPKANHLQAALLIDIPDPAKLAQDLAAWQHVKGDELRLRVGDKALAAQIITCRPEDRCIGAAHWVQFPCDAAARKLLMDFRQPALGETIATFYRHQSAPLNEDVRQSLVEDLEPARRAG